MKSHRGLASVVGAVFLIAIVIGSLSYITYSLEIMGSFSESLITEESRLKDKQGEAFQITSVDITAGNKLDAVIKNTGQIPLKITTLYIDEMGVNDVVNKIKIDKTIAPGASFDFITESIDIDIDPAKGYNVKLITSRGETKTFFINSGSSEPIHMQLTTIPQTVSTGFPSTLLYTVVNNMSNNNVLYNLTPNLEITSATGVIVSAVGPTPSEYPSLGPGDVAIFQYVYTISGDEGDFINFGISLSNGFSVDSSHLQSSNSTISVKDVEIAIKSGTSLTTFGLSDSSAENANLLLFHQENWGVPANLSPAYQMDSSDVQGIGTVHNTDDGTLSFVTSNVTESTTLYLGIFNASLQYFSNVTSPDLPDPSFAFHFEGYPNKGGDKTAESTGNIDAFDANKGFIKTKDTKPLWRDPASVTDGPDADGYFSFIGAKSWMDDDFDPNKGSNNISTIDVAPSTEALWIRIPTATANYMPVVRFGDIDKSDEAGYEISIGSDDGANPGKIVFKFTPDLGAVLNETVCMTGNRYDNNNWQHVVAVRTASSGCEIWINGVQIVTNVGSGIGDIYIKKIMMGSVTGNKDDASTHLTADIASWIHWNKDALDQSDIEDLFYTNYGTNATRAHVTISHINNDGTTVHEVLVDDTEFEFPYHEPSKRSHDDEDYYHALYDDTASDAKNKYQRFNFTAALTGIDRTLSTGDRLLFEIKIDNDEQNLPMNIWFSDTDYADVLSDLDDYNSFLQTPRTDPIWPSFLTFACDEEVTLTVFNDGPDGLWLTFPGTRFVLTSNDGITSYGAMPQTVSVDGAPALDIDSNQDGPYVPDQSSAEILFFQLKNPARSPPSPSIGDDVPSGEYTAFVYLSGFDEEGESFLRTVSLGIVQITPNEPSCS